ncbi:MAG: cupin domain-containing protein [Lysobacter sp.]|nr:cupin domain-containing protein [Lysobacter sp.]
MSTALAPADALAALAAGGGGKPGLALFTHGSLAVEVYRPVDRDRQTPHARDEVYVVIAGRGMFHCGDERTAFGPGALLFVPAGAEHRFEDFSDDFSTWVLFYGPHGGEHDA